MTNKELLNPTTTAYVLMTEHERQRAYLLHMMAQAKPCASCGKPLTPWEAADLDLDEFDMSVSTASREYHCTSCKAPLEFQVPFFAVQEYYKWALKETDNP